MGCTPAKLRSRHSSGANILRAKVMQMLKAKRDELAGNLATNTSQVLDGKHAQAPTTANTTNNNSSSTKLPPELIKSSLIL